MSAPEHVDLARHLAAAALSCTGDAQSKLDAASTLLDALCAVLIGADPSDQEQVADLLESISRKTAEVAAKIRARSAS